MRQNKNNEGITRPVLEDMMREENKVLDEARGVDKLLAQCMEEKSYLELNMGEYTPDTTLPPFENIRETLREVAGFNYRVVWVEAGECRSVFVNLRPEEERARVLVWNIYTRPNETVVTDAEEYFIGYDTDTNPDGKPTVVNILLWYARIMEKALKDGSEI